MKKILMILIVLALVMGATLVVGCSDSSEKTDTGETMMEEEDMEMETTESATPEEMEEETEESLPASGIPEAQPGSYTDLTAAQAKQLIDTTPGLVIIDVSPHYAEGHIPGAVNYYLGDGSLENAIPTLDKNATYLVYCHVDSASIGGAQALVDAGFTKVYRLAGNYAAWVDAGYPVEQ